MLFLIDSLPLLVSLSAVDGVGTTEISITAIKASAKVVLKNKTF
jgi:hypothetical protein